MKKLARTLLVLTLALSLSIGFIGHSLASSSVDPSIDISKEVKIIMYFINSKPYDWDTMMAAFNEKLKADLNATLEVTFINWGDFNTKYPLVLSSGEPVDLIYTSTWLDYYYNASRGAFMALEDLLPTYAPLSWTQLTDDKNALFQATVDGHVYSLPTQKKTYSSFGAIVRGDLMDKYGIPEFNDFDGYEVYLQSIVDNEPDMMPIALAGSSGFLATLALREAGYYSISDYYWIDPHAEDPQVFCVADWDGLPAFLEKMNDWYARGFWDSSVLASSDSTLFQTGKAASWLHSIDGYATQCLLNPDWNPLWMRFNHTVYTLSNMQDAMAIPSSAKNPERALMLCELLRTDQSYWDLFCYGIDGLHSNILEDGSVKVVDTNNFQIDIATWALRTEALDRRVSGYPDAYWTARESMIAVAENNKFNSFFVTTDEIKNEWAAISNVMSQYWDPLVLGYTDDVTGLAELQQQLNAAGVDTVRDALQAQVDAFVAAFDSAN